MKALELAMLLDAFRVVPRLVLIGYSYLVYYVVNWFMNLENPVTQQAALVTTVVGASAAVIGLYNNSGTKWPSKSNQNE